MSDQQHEKEHKPCCVGTWQSDEQPGSVELQGALYDKASHIEQPGHIAAHDILAFLHAR